MTASTRQDTTWRRPDMAALLACTSVVAVVTFALSFAGLYGYGHDTVRLPWWLAPLVPVGVDVLTLVAVAATVALRHSPWHVRLYAWLVFAVALAASVAGNLSHAVRRGLTWDGQIGAAAWPALLALAAHLVVVTWRHLDKQTPTRPAPARAVTVPAAESRRPVVEKVTDKRGQALALVAGGMTQADAAAKVGASERSVARWVAKSKAPDAAPAAN